MEKEIGELYENNRELYEKKAKTYTLKYAMTDYFIFDNQSLRLLKQLSEEDEQTEIQT
jgi:alpha-ketoglutarate-dependent taurine dioxygenase